MTASSETLAPRSCGLDPHARSLRHALIGQGSWAEEWAGGMGVQGGLAIGIARTIATTIRQAIVNLNAMQQREPICFRNELEEGGGSNEAYFVCLLLFV